MAWPNRKRVQQKVKSSAPRAEAQAELAPAEKKLGSSSRCQLHTRQQCTSMTRETAQLGYSRRNTGHRVREDTFCFCAALVRLQSENFIHLELPLQEE